MKRNTARCRGGWKRIGFRQQHILDNDGTHVAGPVHGEANAAFIVDAVNHYKALLADNIALHNLACVNRWKREITGEKEE